MLITLAGIDRYGLIGQTGFLEHEAIFAGLGVGWK